MVFSSGCPAVLEVRGDDLEFGGAHILHATELLRGLIDDLVVSLLASAA